MTAEELKKFLEENKEKAEYKAVLEAYAPKTPLTKENIVSFLQKNNDVKNSILQPEVNKAIETWKENNLEKIVAEELKKQNPSETEEQKQIRLLSEKLEKMEKQNKIQSLKSKMLKNLTAKNLPVDLIDFISFNDESEVDAITETLEQTIKKEREAITKELIKKFGIDEASLNKGDSEPKFKNPFIKGENYSLYEQIKLKKTNPDLYEKLKREAGI